MNPTAPWQNLTHYQKKQLLFMTPRSKPSIWFPILWHVHAVAALDLLWTWRKTSNTYASNTVSIHTQQDLPIAPILPAHKMACLFHFNPGSKSIWRSLRASGIIKGWALAWWCCPEHSSVLPQTAGAWSAAGTLGLRPAQGSVYTGQLPPASWALTLEALGACKLHIPEGKAWLV